MKRTQKILSLFLLLAFVVSACGGTPASTQQPATAGAVQPGAAGQAQKTLRVWIQWGDNPQQIQALFDKYGAANGVKVEVTAPLATDKILPALTGSDAPDILVLSGGDLVKSYYKEALVDELSSAIQTEKIDLNDMFSAPLNQCKMGDKILCLPWGSDMYVVCEANVQRQSLGLAQTGSSGLWMIWCFVFLNSIEKNSHSLPT